MAEKPLKLDEIGYWSEVKLEIVRKYAAAYSRILSAQRSIKAHIYIDAFAGRRDPHIEGDRRRRVWQPGQCDEHRPALL